MVLLFSSPQCRGVWKVAFLALVVGGCAGAPGPSIRLVHGEGEASSASFEVSGLRAAELERLGRIDDVGQWQEIFPVRVVLEVHDTGGPVGVPEDIPAVLGSYRVDDDTLTFTPRFRLRPGLRYRADLDLSGHGGTGIVVSRAASGVFEIPGAELAATTMVERVYPTADVLPENVLKFYLHFSAPMSRGLAYHHIRLLGPDGKPVALPFLELDQELWDAPARRFTLFFDPARVKRELLPNDLEGRALVEGERYRLVIDRRWLDARGRPLGSDFVKDFRAGPPDYTQPRAGAWRLAVPDSGTRDPLAVAFAEPLDHALLERVLWVEDSRGDELRGVAEVRDGERGWRFRPDAPWAAGEYRLVVRTTLEDMAGNSVGNLFEMDLFENVTPFVNVPTEELAFDVQ